MDREIRYCTAIIVYSSELEGRSSSLRTNLMKRFVVPSGWALLGLAALSAASSDGARAGQRVPHAVGIPGIGPGTGVDVYIPNPDEQTPIAWSQGTEPPPPQGDYRGGALQYTITGDESRPVAHPRVPPPYFPARVAPVQGPDGRSTLATHARPPEGSAYGDGFGGRGSTLSRSEPPRYRDPGQAHALLPYPGQGTGGYDSVGFGGASPVGYGSAPGAVAAPAAYASVERAQADIDPIYRRQEVAYPGSEAPGTVVIDTESKFLYLVEAPGHALRYGIGVAKPGFLWSGTHTISRKAEWPDWTPPAEMLGRRPDLPRHMEGGVENPLGARALYLGSTLYRIHGTNEPNTIGTNVSSGCIRLRNEDVTDLYGRVRVGTRVVVI